MLHILPFPKEVREEEGGALALLPRVCTKNPAWEAHVATFIRQIYKALRVELTNGEGGFEAVYDETLAPNAYVIDTTGDACVIRASHEEGLFYGMASAIQMVDSDESGLSVKKAYIHDHPDKKYRSLMVDLSRNWHPFHQVLKYVDLCFLYKVSYLHLHFIDDQRYTLPSKKYPNLPTKDESYTEEQIRELNAYAAARGVNIVPEFECPGHARSITTAYPEIFANVSDGTGEGAVSEMGAPISGQSLLCAGSEKAFSATLDLLKEVSDLFPNSEYLHIGGDEAAIALWNECPHCRDYMAKNGIQDVHEMYSEYVGKVTDYVLTLGKTPIVWEGFPKAGSERISKKVVVVAWESHYHYADELLEEGFTVINAAWQPLYIVPSMALRWTPNDILAWNVYNWQHWWPYSKMKLNPLTVPATDKVCGSILCAWEMTFEQEAARVMENLIAMNERVWNVIRVHGNEEYHDVFWNLYSRAAKMMQ